MPDLSLRRLRYFVAVAEELHFGRAAELLRVAQPVLSRQIAVLEREVGVRLFDRSSAQGTALSSAGAGLLARGTQRLAIGFMPGLVVSPLARLLTERFPDLDVPMTRTSCDDQIQALRDGRVDLSLVRLPADLDGLGVAPLLDEPRVVALPVTHPLAGRGRLGVSDLAPYDLLQDPSAVPEWRLARLRQGLAPNPPVGTPRPHAVEEKLELVAAGRGVAVLPTSTARFYQRPDVTYLDVIDLAPNEVVLAWLPHRTSPALRFAVDHADALRVSNLDEEVLDESAPSA